MKKIYYILLVILALFLLAYLIANIYFQKDYSDYFKWKGHNKFSYLVTKDTVSKKDTLKLIMLEEADNNYKNNWILTYYDAQIQNYLCDTIIVKTLTEIDIHRNLYWNHPTIKYFYFTHYLPSIDIPLPLEQGYYKEFKHNLTSIDIENGADTSVSSFRGHIKISGKTFFQTPLFQDSCWIIEGKYDKLNSYFKTYFNNQYGFVYFQYFYNGCSIELKLYSIE